MPTCGPVQQRFGNGRLRALVRARRATVVNISLCRGRSLGVVGGLMPHLSAMLLPFVDVPVPCVSDA